MESLLYGATLIALLCLIIAWKLKCKGVLFTTPLCALIALVLFDIVSALSLSPIVGILIVSGLLTAAIYVWITVEKAKLLKEMQ